MAIRFYGDESEDRDEKVLAIGGFIGLADAWNELQEKWIARVKPTGVTAYHMIDCECGWGEFSESKGWTKPDRDKLTIDLINLIIQHDVFMLGFAVLVDDYKQIAPVNDEGDHFGRDKWHLAFQGIVQEAANRVGDGVPPEETIAFVFDWKQKQGAAEWLFEHTQNEVRLKSWRHRLGTLAFGHKEFEVRESEPLLQVADIAAVETRKALGSPIARPELPERKSLTKLKQAGKVWSMKYLNRPILEVMYEMKRADLGLPNKAEEAEKKLAQARRSGTW
jgi:hypothetical protein